MRSISETQRGIGIALGSVALVAACLSLAFASLGDPGKDLMYGLAGFGASVFLAYILEAVWLVDRIPGHRRSANWIGFVAGLGFAGLSAVFVSLAVAAHLEAGHSNALDTIGLAWSVAAVVLLGAIVAYQPLLAADGDPD